MPNKTMKVMLVDDHELFMEGLQYLLKTHGMDVVCTVSDGEKALMQARRTKPDIILLDIKIPNCSGLDILRQIKAVMPEVKVVMLTTSDDDDDLINAIKCGASGYLLKNTSAKELVEMLCELEKGEIPLSPRLATILFREFRRGQAAEESKQPVEKGGRVVLTKRQLDVLEMVAGGMTYKQVGRALGLSERTIKYHMGRIIEQLHLENRAQVIAYAVQMGLIE